MSPRNARAADCCPLLRADAEWPGWTTLPRWSSDRTRTPTLFCTWDTRGRTATSGRSRSGSELAGLVYDETALSLKGEGLDAFLAGLARDWRGWNGVRTWDALEDGISVRATHHGKRVELLFIVRCDYRPMLGGAISRLRRAGRIAVTLRPRHR